MIRISWRRLTPIVEKELSDIEKLRQEWVPQKEDAKKYQRIVGDYVVEIECYEKLKDLMNELLNSLAKPFPILDSIFRFLELTKELLFDTFELWVNEDGVIQTAFLDYIWFHGQEIVNVLLRKFDFELEVDYEGETRVKTWVRRPVTHESMNKALKRIYYGIILYHIIKRAQESVALNVTLLFINTFLRKQG